MGSYGSVSVCSLFSKRFQFGPSESRIDRKLSPVEASQYLDAFLKGREAPAGKSLLSESQMPAAVAGTKGVSLGLGMTLVI